MSTNSTDDTTQSGITAKCTLEACKLINRLRIKLLNRMILRPSRDSLDGGTQSRREFSTSHGRLEYFIHSRMVDDGPPPWLLLKFPGTGGRAERSTDFPLGVVSPVGGEVWTLNPPGYGQSQGRACLAILVDAAAAFVEHALETGVGRETRLLLCGNSLGCATVLGVAAKLCESDVAQRHSIGLYLRNVPPLAHVFRHVASRYPLGSTANPIARSIPRDMDAIASASRVHVPALFLVSELDSLVPASLQREVHNAYAGKKRVVTLKGLEHDSPLEDTHLPEVVAALHWLANTMTQH